MTLLTLDRVACATPDGTPLFSDLSLSLNRDRVGLVGRNGAGKSTLLNAIAGRIPVVQGAINRRGKVALLEQTPVSASSLAGALGVAEGLARLDRIEKGRASQQDVVEADWALVARMEVGLAAVGLPLLDWRRPLSSLSGGERTRVMLASLLLAEPDILLLDEPTNNLDDDGRAAIADLIAGWTGGALIATHDRRLLERVDRIVELTSTGIHIVGGGWKEFHDQRSAERAQAAEALQRSETELRSARRERQHELEKQARRDKAGRRTAAKDVDPRMFLFRQQQRAEKSAARYHQVGDEIIERASQARDVARGRVETLTPIRITLPRSGLASGHLLVRARGVTCERAGRRLFGPLDLDVRGSQRIALLGRNGSGKTSLIRYVLGHEPPASGEIWADRPRIALLDQDLALLGNSATLVEAIRRTNPSLELQAAHEALAAYGFRNRWAHRTVCSLSGGERVRLALACLFSGRSPPQMLVLDEPTNHLDVEATEMLEAALSDYDGAILCVSHDAAFRTGLGLAETICLG